MTEFLNQIPRADHFVGRDNLRGLLHRVLSGYEALTQPHLICGQPGIGKTALVAECVANHAMRENVVWLKVESHTDVHDVAIEFNEIAGRRLIKKLGAVSSGQIIAVVDGADALPDEDVADIVNKLKNVRLVRCVLITSRRIITSILAPAIRVEPLNATESSDLFKTRARVSIERELRDQIFARADGNPQLLLLMVELLNRYGVAALNSLWSVPIYDITNVIPDGQIVEVCKPKLIVVGAALMDRLQKEPESIFQLDSRRFEEVLAELLEDMGAEVELTPASNDGGRDIIAKLDTEFGKLLWLVEAKRYRKDHKVGVELVRQLFGTLHDHDATCAMLVTSSSFTRGAQEFQKRHEYEISLKDYSNVVGWIQGYGKKSKGGIILPS